MAPTVAALLMPLLGMPSSPPRPPVQALLDVLGGIPYNDNDVYLHTDESLMPVGFQCCICLEFKCCRLMHEVHRPIVARGPAGCACSSSTAASCWQRLRAGRCAARSASAKAGPRLMGRSATQHRAPPACPLSAGVQEDMGQLELPGPLRGGGG